MTGSRRRAASTLLLAALLSSSCGLLSTLQGQPDGGEIKEEAPTSPEKPSAEERDLLLSRAKALLDSGEHEAAFETFAGIRSKFGGDRRVDQAYLGAFEEVYRKAGTALGQGDCSAAGVSYYLLDRKFATLGALSADLSFTARDVSSGLDRCRRLLSLRGLEQYRHGNLGEAVSSWESLLRFDPANEEIRKAVDTSTIQMEELEKGKTPPGGESP